MKKTRVRRPKVRLLVCSFIIAAGVVLAALGVMRSVTGDEAQRLPEALERIDPVSNAVQVPSQSKLFVDLDVGFTGVLVVDGLELPTTDLAEITADTEAGQQAPVPLTTVFEPGNATLTFTPIEGAPIESWTEGIHTARVIYWKLIEGRGTAKSFAWNFNVY